MNKQEFKAITIIANKMDWQQKPVSDVIESVKQMVRNQQALELDTVGECDDDEETLLSIALWDKDKITSIMYVSSYQDLVMWGVYCFCDDMGITPEDFSAMLSYYSCSAQIMASEYEMEEMARYDAYCDAWENSYC